MPILGVCLGHQAIGQAFGGKVVRARPRDARQDSTQLEHDGHGRVRGPARRAFRRRATTRWWSSATRCPPASRSRALDARTARSWACATETLPVEGVQFHPESLLTEHGHALLQEFL